MSKILSRFRRAASTSSDDQQYSPGSTTSPRLPDLDIGSSTSGSDDESRTILSSNSSSLGRTTLSGSHFYEEEIAQGTPLSPNRSSTRTGPIYPGGTLTPSPSKNRLELNLPDSATRNQAPLGTPKLVLTDPGSNSPRSFSSSPSRDSPAQIQRQTQGLGLGIGTQAKELYSSSSVCSTIILSG